MSDPNNVRGQEEIKFPHTRRGEFFRRDVSVSWYFGLAAISVLALVACSSPQSGGSASGREIGSSGVGDAHARPCGLNSQIQFNDSGGCGAEANLTWDKTSKSFAIGANDDENTGFSVNLDATKTTKRDDERFVVSVYNSPQSSNTLGSYGAYFTVNARANTGYKPFLRVITGDFTGVGNQDIGEVASVAGEWAQKGNGHIGFLASFLAEPSLTNAAVVKQVAGYRTKSLAGTGGTTYSFYSEDTGAGPNDYSYYSAGGKNYFGGVVNSIAGFQFNSAAPNNHVLCGNGTAYVDSATCGWQSGTTSTIRGTSLSNTCDSGTAAVPGAKPGMPVNVSTVDGSDVGGAFNLRASVTSTNTVTVFVCGTGTPPSKAYNVRVIP
jgi:hypothetical protein